MADPAPGSVMSVRALSRPNRQSAWLVIAMAGLMLQGCNESPRPLAAAAGARVFSADMNGAAKSCEAPQPNLTDGKPSEAAMTVGNDGGWCAITLTRPGGKPYDAGLLNVDPEHGKVLIHEVGDVTRIDYTPDPRFAGHDAFEVTLLPGEAGLRVGVTVTPSPEMAATPTKR